MSPISPFQWPLHLLTKYRLEQGACALERKANKESTSWLKYLQNRCRVRSSEEALMTKVRSGFLMVLPMNHFYAIRA